MQIDLLVSFYDTPHTGIFQDSINQVIHSFHPAAQQFYHLFALVVKKLGIILGKPIGKLTYSPQRSFEIVRNNICKILQFFVFRLKCSRALLYPVLKLGIQYLNLFHLRLYFLETFMYLDRHHVECSG